MSDAPEPPDPDGLADDTVVLGGIPEPPPRSGPRLGRRGRWIAMGLAVVLVATAAWMNRPGRGGPGPIADDVFEPGSRTRPLYPGADGRLLFTVLEEPTAGEIAGETLWSVRLDTGAVERGPLLPPVGTASGFPAGPGVPPGREFALGPRDSFSAGTLAFLGDGSLFLGGRRFAWTLDVGSSRLGVPAPVGEAAALAWRPDGSLLALHPNADGTWGVDAIQPRGAQEAAALVNLPESVPSLAFTGRRLFLIVSSSPYGGSTELIQFLDGDRAQTLLSGWRVVGHGLNAGFLVRRPGAPGAREIALWHPGEEPALLPGYAPERIVGWTGDRQHYASVGEFRGEYGVWFTAWPNTPVFLMRELDRDAGESVDVVAFDGPGAAAFFVVDLDLWMVQIGSEESRRVPLSDEAAREVPSGPLIWIP
ncbi:MAG: hypothetical protein LC722_00220 [Actinobacteria bacterium]|nr:hypothetical protein [Actinomycetota bacterium]